jgi:serine/alanine adding enzyme
LTGNNKIQRDTEVSRDKWNVLVAENPFSSPFQTPEFYSFFNSLPGLSAHVFAYGDNDTLQALCLVTLQKETGIKSYFSRRAIIYGGPLLTPGNFDATAILLNAVSDFFKARTIYIETRNFFNYNSFQNVFDQAGWKFLPYLNFQINLENKTGEDLMAAMQYNRKREIRMSLNQGVVYSELSNENDFRDLYGILSDLYSSRVKLPLPAFNYFQQQEKSGIAKVFIVKHSDKVIGGSICPVLAGKAIYTYYYCGLRDYNPKIFPTHIAIWAAIVYAIENGMKIFDFMGAGKPHLEYGVRRYKKEFGGETVEHGRFIYICNPALFHLGKWGLKLLAKR